MILINKTRCPDSILEPLLRHAAHSVGANPDNVHVKVTQGRTCRVGGLAERKTCSFKINLPRPSADTIDDAYIFHEIAMHEWGHIRDYQALQRGESLQFTYYRNNTSSRKINHDLRPQEVRADRYVKEVKAKIARKEIPCPDECVLNLAIYLESRNSNHV